MIPRWFPRRKRRPQPPAPRLSPSEAIIISRSGHTEQSWSRLTHQQRATIRARIGIGR